jgi:uncharacterized protein (UPF0261 family)
MGENVVTQMQSGMDKTILVVGTYDTKQDELTYLADRIRAMGGGLLSMDVSILRDAKVPIDITKHDVAAADDSSIAAAIALDDENAAMQVMARGATKLAKTLFAEGRFDAVIVLGGTMGTDLALDLCAGLPLGVPKYVVSTVSFSPMIPPERLAADIQMILWAGGLYGLNPICKAALSQAAGAVLGAARAVEKPDFSRPVIGITGFSSTVLKYVIPLKPALEARGYDVAVFHGTGMGGRAFESLASQNIFAAVLDFAPQEVGNHLMGSAISAGSDRMTNAGLAGIPQIIAPGCADLIDYVTWQAPPPRFATHENHAHNRLLSSILLSASERREVAKTLCQKLAMAKGPVTFLLPTRGFHLWDQPGGPLCDPEAIAALCDEITRLCPPNVRLVTLDAHINDAAFADAALAVVDDWRAKGVLPV